MRVLLVTLLVAVASAQNSGKCEENEGACGIHSVCVDSDDSFYCQCENQCEFYSPTGDGRDCVESSYLTEFEGDTPDCYCGSIVTEHTRECVWFEGSSAEQCVRKSSNTDSSKCGHASLKKDYSPEYHGTCLVNFVSDKTDCTYYAATWDPVDYKVYTKLGQMCDLGYLDQAGINDRVDCNIDTYYINYQCNACMQSATETYDYVTVTIDGDDGWLCDWIVVQVNGNNMTYTNGNWLDNYGTLKFEHEY